MCQCIGCHRQNWHQQSAPCSSLLITAQDTILKLLAVPPSHGCARDRDHDCTSSLDPYIPGKGHEVSLNPRASKQEQYTCLTGLALDLDSILFSVLPLSSSTHCPTQTILTLLSVREISTLYQTLSLESITSAQAGVLVWLLYPKDIGLFIPKTYSKI